jgi:hypothetical protein
LKNNQQADDLSAWGIGTVLFAIFECNLCHPTLISNTLSPTTYEYLVEILNCIIAILVLILSTFFDIGPCLVAHQVFPFGESGPKMQKSASVGVDHVILQF